MLYCDAVREESEDDKRNEEEKETLSDLDDEELNIYINTPQEIERKTIIWNEVYKDYLQKQAGSLIFFLSFSFPFSLGF
jgi:predicted restriction endonuclease